MEKLDHWIVLFFGVVLGAWVGIGVCVPGFYVDGVTARQRLDSVFRCHRIPARRYEEDREQRPFLAMPDLPGEGFEYDARIVCPRTRPIVWNEHTVGCEQ